MRKVSLNMILPNMRLATPLYHKNRMLLKEGTKDLNRFVANLEQLGISSIYIEDRLCEDIEIQDAISEKARYQCKNALKETLEGLKVNGRVDEVCLFQSIDEILDEIINRSDILISLSDIGTTDDSTLIHSVNMTVYSLLIGKQLGYSREQMKKLAEGCILHDVGKILLEHDILYKPGKLTQEEFKYVQQHPVLGYNILKKNPLFTELSRIICLSHHERIDGSGYPDGLRGNEIHEFSRIAAITDVYDAVTSSRCYHKEKSIYEAVDILMQEASTKLDASLVALFLQNIAVYPNGTIVKLSDGKYAVVKSQNNDMPFRPIVRVIDPWEQVPLYEINLMKNLTITIEVPAVTNIIK